MGIPCDFFRQSTFHMCEKCNPADAIEVPKYSNVNISLCGSAVYKTVYYIHVYMNVI